MAGTTPGSQACTLVVRADGSYDHRSSTLTYSYTPTWRTIRVFSHSSNQVNQQVI